MFFHKYLTLVLLLALVGCDDINPSSDDNRPVVASGTIGPAVGQVAPDFALFDTLENPVTLSAELTGVDGIVLYFTMWCPVCDSHMSHMRSETIPEFPQVRFYFVDYVSGSVSVSRAAQLANGYGSSLVLVDDIQHVLNLYDATMGTTVVIDSSGLVQYNEDFKDGSKLAAVLAALP